MHGVLIKLRKSGVRRSGHDLLTGLDWTLRAGEHWAVLGENGAGKSTFLRLVRGELPPTSGSRTYFLDGQAQTSPIGLRQRMPLVSPEMQEAYADPGDHDPAPMRAQSGEEAVLAGLYDTRLLYEEPGRAARERARDLLRELGLGKLADQPVGAMSTGQLRAILLARALFSLKGQGQDTGLSMLLLDECLDGLDRDARRTMLGLMETLGARVPLLVAAHRPQDLPGCVNRVLKLRGGRVVSQGEYIQGEGHADRGGADLDDTGLGQSRRNGVDAGRTDHGCAGQERADRSEAGAGSNKKNAPSADQDAPDFLFRLNGVSVVLEGRTVLEDIRWTVRPGEHWALAGENGAGKSTLLRLVLGLAEPHGRPWPEYFGGAGTPGRPADLTEMRRHFGFLSTELQTAYDRRATVRQAVLSGFFGSVGLFEEPGPEQEKRARRAMALFGLTGLANTPLSALSFGQVRRALLARAVAPGPELLLLDEPLSGLDAQARRMALAAIKDLARAGAALVWVSHRQGELPDCVDKVLALRQGRMICQGGRECLSSC